MNRASPVEMRRSLDMAKALQEAGILFVPMPVANAVEASEMIERAQDRLERMALDADSGGEN